MEVLCTLPIKDYELIIGKFLSSISLILVGLIYALYYFLLGLSGGDMEER